MGNPGVNGAGRINAAAAVGVAPSSTATTVPAGGTPTTTRSGSGRGAVVNDPFSGTNTTQGTLPPELVSGDELAFSGGPGNNTDLVPVANRKKAQEVSLATMFITLVAIAVLGGGWGAISLARRDR